MSTGLWIAIIVAIVVGVGGSLWAYWNGEVRSKRRQ